MDKKNKGTVTTTPPVTGHIRAHRTESRCSPARGALRAAKKSETASPYSLPELPLTCPFSCN